MARHKPRLTMPSAHHEHDREFIDGMLSRLSPAHQLRARVAYTDVFSNERDSTKLEYQKSNHARRAANIRLREFVDACVSSYAQSSQVSIKKAKSQFEGF